MNKELPNFATDYLNEVATAFKKRNKAIQYKGRNFTFDKEIDNNKERLNVDFVAANSTQVRVSIWEDGIMYFRICLGSKKGWIFNIQFYGDATNIRVNELVETFEESIHLSTEEKLMAVWKNINPYKE
jgi:hypothetical protein